MKVALHHVRLLFKRLGLVLLVYTLCRVLFLVLNRSHFEASNLLLSFLGGLRFDISAVAFCNALFILLSLAPLPFLNKAGYQRFLLILLLVLNLPGTILNLADTEYYQFTSKRSTADFFDLMFLGDDMWTLLPSYLMDFWHLPLLLLLALFIIFRMLKRLDYSKTESMSLNYIWQSVALVLILGLTVLGFRGGFQLRPIDKLSALEYGQAKDIPLVINTPFSIIKSWNKEYLQRKDYFNESELEKIYSPIHISKNDNKPKKNVVLLIMESFSKKYVGKTNEKGLAFTPFLDSLSSVGVSFEHSYANGRTSIGALPALLAGIPVVMEEPYITSPYGGNQIDALPLLLAKHGYSSSFFHGGKTGTMGFNKFCKTAGFDHYYGLEDHPVKEDYDGKWEIFDEPFFQFAAGKMASKSPFFSTVFSLSSHHPYLIPDDVTHRYTDYEPGFGRSIRYADDAIKAFFTSAKGQAHYENTLFIITADHIPNANDPGYLSALGSFSVPIIFYDPSGEFTSDCTIAQHTDVQATVMDYLGLESEFIGFGNSLIRNEKNWTFQYIHSLFQYYEEDYILRYDGKDHTVLLHIDDQYEAIARPEIEARMLPKLKAILQQCHNRMISNQLSSER